MNQQPAKCLVNPQKFSQLIEAHNKEIKNIVELHSQHMEDERSYAAERYGNNWKKLQNVILLPWTQHL